MSIKAYGIKSIVRTDTDYEAKVEIFSQYLGPLNLDISVTAHSYAEAIEAVRQKLDLFGNELIEVFSKAGSLT